MITEKHAKAQLGEAAPLPDLLVDLDPLVRERTVFDKARVHRFTWFRYLDSGDPDDYVAGIGMNPSGASEDKVDRTVLKMVKFARRWGAPAYYQLNAMSLRGTYSTELGDAPCVNLPENDVWIRRIAAKARFVVVAWGEPAHKNGRGAEVSRILREVCDPAKVFCFKLNQSGAPVHALYQKDDAVLIPYFDALAKHSK